MAAQVCANEVVVDARRMTPRNNTRYFMLKDGLCVIVCVCVLILIIHMLIYRFFFRKMKE